MLTLAFIPAPIVFNPGPAIDADSVTDYEQESMDDDRFDDDVAARDAHIFAADLAWDIMTADPVVSEQTSGHRSELGYSRRSGRAKLARQALAGAERRHSKRVLAWIR